MDQGDDDMTSQKKESSFEIITMAILWSVEAAYFS
jgi:hypothetical protein